MAAVKDEIEKRPRKYADEILEYPGPENRARRRAMLEAVPAHLREMVRTHVNCAYARRA